MITDSTEQIRMQPEAMSLADYLGRWSVVLSPICGIALLAWGIHYFWHRYDPLIVIFLWLPTGITRIYYRYLRAFRPERVPAMLADDSGELARLKEKKGRLTQAGCTGFGVCVLFGLIVRVFIGTRPGDICFFMPDALGPWLVLPVFASGVAFYWGEVLEVQIKERTPPAVKLARGVTTSRAPRTGVVISGAAYQGNGFRSEHWGEQGASPQVQIRDRA